MEGTLYLVAAVVTPRKKEIEEDGKLSQVVLEPTPVIARDDKDAAIKVVMGNSDLQQVDADRLEVIVRPF